MCVECWLNVALVRLKSVQDKDKQKKANGDGTLTYDICLSMDLGKSMQSNTCSNPNLHLLVDSRDLMSFFPVDFLRKQLVVSS